MKMQTPTFSRTDKNQFFRTLNKRVNDYFKEHNIDKTGNWKLHLKTIILFTVFLAPYFIILTLDLPFCDGGLHAAHGNLGGGRLVW